MITHTKILLFSLTIINYSHMMDTSKKQTDVWKRVLTFNLNKVTQINKPLVLSKVNKQGTHVLAYSYGDKKAFIVSSQGQLQGEIPHESLTIRPQFTKDGTGVISIAKEKDAPTLFDLSGKKIRTFRSEWQKNEDCHYTTLSKCGTFLLTHMVNFEQRKADLTVWNINGTEVRTRFDASGKQVAKFNTDGSVVCFQPMNQELKLWDVSKNSISSLSRHRDSEYRHVDLHPKKEIYLETESPSAKLRNFQGKELVPFSDYYIKKASWNSSGTHILLHSKKSNESIYWNDMNTSNYNLGDNDHFSRVYTIDGKETATIDRIVKFTPDGTAIFTKVEKKIQFLDLKGKTQASLKHAIPIQTAKLSSDGTTLASFDNKGIIHIWKKTE